MPAQVGSRAGSKKGVVSQPPSAISANTLFLACNFGNKRVKGHFDKLQKDWEAHLPVRVYISDKVTGEGARDLWQDIVSIIKEANLAIFDVTSFRPNVVLELGVALAVKQSRQIVICRDLTPGGRTSPKQTKWLLSDIGHLNRIEYKSFRPLDKKLLQHLERMAPVKYFYKLCDEIKSKYPKETSRYVIAALRLLLTLRDNGPTSPRDLRSCVEGLHVNVKKLEDLLVRFNLAKPAKGKKGVWKLVD